MTSLVATRSELLARRSQRAFVAQGRDLIWDKRSALVREFHRHRHDTLAALAQLGEVAADARQALDRAYVADGETAVAAASLAAEHGVDVHIQRRVIAGVEVVDLQPAPVVRGPLSRGWAAVAVSCHVDAAADAYERYLDRFLQICHLELTLRRLAAEITRATRQANALENVVIPRLEDEEAAITASLDEREREEQARLRRARATRAQPPDHPLPTRANTSLTATEEPR